jgi:hypothetical protein
MNKMKFFQVIAMIGVANVSLLSFSDPVQAMEEDGEDQARAAVVRQEDELEQEVIKELISLVEQRRAIVEEHKREMGTLLLKAPSDDKEIIDFLGLVPDIGAGARAKRDQLQQMKARSLESLKNLKEALPDVEDENLTPEKLNELLGKIQQVQPLVERLEAQLKREDSEFTRECREKAVAVEKMGRAVVVDTIKNKTDPLTKRINEIVKARPHLQQYLQPSAAQQAAPAAAAAAAAAPGENVQKAPNE